MRSYPLHHVPLRNHHPETRWQRRVGREVAICHRREEKWNPKVLLEASWRLQQLKGKALHGDVFAPAGRALGFGPRPEPWLERARASRIVAQLEQGSECHSMGASRRFSAACW